MPLSERLSVGSLFALLSRCGSQAPDPLSRDVRACQLTYAAPDGRSKDLLASLAFIDSPAGELGR
jgi:hypothetical protein